jgi:hypothetical protein
MTVLSLSETWQQAMAAWSSLGFETPKLHG